MMHFFHEFFPVAVEYIDGIPAVPQVTIALALIVETRPKQPIVIEPRTRVLYRCRCHPCTAAVVRDFHGHWELEHFKRRMDHSQGDT